MSPHVSDAIQLSFGVVSTPRRGVYSVPDTTLMCSMVRNELIVYYNITLFDKKKVVRDSCMFTTNNFVATL